MNLHLPLHVASISARKLVAFAGCALIAGCASTPSGNTFATPEAAADALVSALRSDDPTQVDAVLGSAGEALLSSGDDVADRADRAAFLSAYDTRHQIVSRDDESVLVVGAGEWPMPIPLVRDGDGWRFDVERGKDEVLARRIGRNELATIQVCRAIVDAQTEYASSDHGHGAGEYARHFLSSAGQQDGLYWPAQDGAPESPLGPLVAAASTDGYVVPASAPAQEDGSRARQPYFGYYYRILDAQGSSAPGGESSYVVGGRMTGGFAVLAQPAAYGNSGVMSFLVGESGIVYQRDLGPDTEKTADAIKAFDPTYEWTLVVD